MSYAPLQEVPFLYMNGYSISNNVAAPNTAIDITAGKCKDSTDVFDIVTNSTITVNGTASGINGLDTGTLQASKVYRVFAVSSPITGLPTMCMLSLSTIPFLPYGYLAYKVIGWVVTDASAHFLKAYWHGERNNRLMMFDAPQATAVTAGAATTYTAVDLSALVPAADGIPVYLATAFTPGAASRTLSMQPYGATGDAVVITGQVTSVIVTTNSMVISKLNGLLPEVSYKVANAGDAVAIKVAGFQFVV